MKISAIIKKDLHTDFRDKIKLLTLVVAIFLPLAYGFLYLWAFWNPYENMTDVPVAVVNEDAGAFYEGKQEYYGERIVKNLEDNDVLGWDFVDYDEAQDGLDNQKYYAIVRIPEDFSTALVSGESDTPRQASITWQTHDSTSFLFTTYFKNVIAVLGKNINEEILPEFSQVAQVKLKETNVKLEEASAGASQLAQGLSTLESGSNTIGTNLQKAADGSQNLTTGLKTLDTKSSNLNNGIAQAKEGSTVLETGLKSADVGTKTLTDGLKQLSDGSTELKNGSAQLSDGTTQLAQGADEMSTKVSSVDEMLNPFYPFLNGFSQIIDSNNQKYSLEVPNYIAPAKEQKDQLVSGSRQIATGADTISENMSKLDTGIGSLQQGAQSASDGAATLSDGITQLSSGSSDLSKGLADIQSGSIQYTAGVNSAYNGSKDLTSGLQQLTDGNRQLTDGLASAQEGATTLSLGLDDGVKQMEEDLTPEKIDTLLDIINEPIKVENYSEDANETYGSGFAPYFIPLALWMGALILTLVKPTRDTKLNLSGVSKAEITIAKFIPLALVGVSQAVLLALSIIYGLGLKTKFTIYFILFCILISLASIAIMQFLSFSLGKVGELIGIIVLMIQLTSASGTFPVQSAPRFFQLCSPFVPMSYAIRGLRIFILGGNMQIARNQVLALSTFVFIFLALKTLSTKRTAKATDIYPLIEL
ncbi:MAG: YhgE/Pip domain-containing protein [Candidatus Pacebacteria bacterium]|nr:YhgE/Pip domain-containing protein [Candidatus Paceibacterota bacterium]